MRETCQSTKKIHPIKSSHHELGQASSFWGKAFNRDSKEDNIYLFPVLPFFSKFLMPNVDDATFKEIRKKWFVHLIRVVLVV